MQLRNVGMFSRFCNHPKHVAPLLRHEIVVGLWSAQRRSISASFDTIANLKPACGAARN
jgi:hypothetical protein